MISNPYLRVKQNAVTKKRQELTKRKREIQEALTEFSPYLTSNGRYRENVDDATKERRAALVKEMGEVDRKLIEIKDEKRSLHSSKEAEENKVVNKLLREIFSWRELEQIYLERDRRLAGEHPFKLDFNIAELIKNKDDCRKYKAFATEQLEKMIEFRILLTKVIEEGCAKFGNADFIKLMSPLNKLIIPLKDLEKVRKEYSLHQNSKR